MVTKEKALDAARLLAEWAGRMAPGTQYDDWIAYRVLGVVTGGATINVDAGSKVISYDRPRLEALQAAWAAATEYTTGVASKWPVWRVYDWRQAIPPLVLSVQNKAALEASGWKPTPVVVTGPAKPAEKSSGAGKALAAAAAIALAIKVLA